MMDTQPTIRPDGSARRSRRPIVIAVGVVLLAVAAVGGYGLWFLFLQPGGPAAIADSSLPPVPTSAPASTQPSASTQPVASSKSGGSGGIDGTWNVDTSIGSFADSTSSFVGYRVQEQLASIGANTAVGRTPNVSGSLTISGTQVTAATITADLTTLQSDDQRRDGQLARQGIQTSQFPTAAFTLTSPIDLGSVPADGQEIQVTATGTLTLHGQTKDVQIPLKARLTGSTITISGSLPIVFADYGIQKPNSFMVLTIADEGTVELQLFFTHA
jgi:polyisoprenoid-binding protein YceI/nitrate reductase NapE component